MSSYNVGQAQFNANLSGPGPGSPSRGDPGLIGATALAGATPTVAISVIPRQVVADVVVQTARNLGYSVRTGTGRQTTAVDARRDHEVVIICVSDGGSVELDHAGIADSSGLDRQLVFEAEMSRLGVELRDIRRVVPADWRGGALITAAARQGDRSLAHAVIKVKEAPSRTGPSGLEREHAAHV